MRRIWIGVGILLALLAVGILVMRTADRQLGGVSETLKQASEVPHWDQAVALAQAAQKDWRRSWQLMAALADHTDMDGIDELFAQLEVYQQHRAETDHAATCARLSEAIRDLAENHRLTWWNLL